MTRTDRIVRVLLPVLFLLAGQVLAETGVRQLSIEEAEKVQAGQGFMSVCSGTAPCPSDAPSDACKCDQMEDECRNIDTSTWCNEGTRYICESAWCLWCGGTDPACGNKYRFKCKAIGAECLGELDCDIENVGACTWTSCDG